MQEMMNVYMNRRDELMDHVGEMCMPELRPVTETFITILIENERRVNNFPHRGLIRDSEGQIIKNLKKCQEMKFDEFDIFAR